MGMEPTNPAILLWRLENVVLKIMVGSRLLQNAVHDAQLMGIILPWLKQRKWCCSHRRGTALATALKSW